MSLLTDLFSQAGSAATSGLTGQVNNLKESAITTAKAYGPVSAAGVILLVTAGILASGAVKDTFPKGRKWVGWLVIGGCGFIVYQWWNDQSSAAPVQQ